MFLRLWREGTSVVQPIGELLYRLRYSGSHIDKNEHKLVTREPNGQTVMRVEYSSLDSSGTESGSETEILTFMGPCIANIFRSITNKMQRYTIYLFL